jgi:hypothetical protein
LSDDHGAGPDDRQSSGPDDDESIREAAAGHQGRIQLMHGGAANQSCEVDAAWRFAPKVSATRGAYMS